MARKKKAVAIDKLVEWIRSNGGGTKTAELLGVSIAAVSRWKQGNRFPEPKTVRKIIKLSDGAVSYADLFNREWSRE